MFNVHFAADMRPNHTFRGYPQLTASQARVEELVSPVTRAGAQWALRRDAIKAAFDTIAPGQPRAWLAAVARSCGRSGPPRTPDSCRASDATEW